MKRIPDITKYDLKPNTYIYGKSKKVANMVSYIGFTAEGHLVKDIWTKNLVGPFDKKEARWNKVTNESQYGYNMLFSEKSCYEYFEIDEQDIDKIIFAETL